MLAGWLVTLTIIGTLIVSFPEKFNPQELKKINFIAWAVFGAVAIGFSDTLNKGIIGQTSVGTFLFCISLAQIPISLLYLKFEKQSLRQFQTIFHKFNEYKYAILSGFILVGGTMFLFLSFNYTLASIASPINASYSVLSVILAMIFLKERISVKNGIGLILVLTSILGIAFIYH